jgi:hypothetical protein
MAKRSKNNSVEQLFYAFGTLLAVGLLVATFMIGIAYGEHQCEEREHRALSSVG